MMRIFILLNFGIFCFDSHAVLSTEAEAILSPGSPPACGPLQSGLSCWASATNVKSDGIIADGGGYSLNAASWPRICPGQNGNLEVIFGSDCNDKNGSKKSMCTSATAAAFSNHIATLVNSKKLDLTPEQISFLNGPQVRNAMNGNTYSVAHLMNYLGGQSVYGKNSSDIADALKQARPGDIMKFDRANGTGHSTIFKEIQGDKVCYWTSNRGTEGVGVQCEKISSLISIAVTRFPTDLDKFKERIDQVRNDKQTRDEFKQAFASPTSAHSVNDITWAESLDCPPVGSSPGYNNNRRGTGATSW
jgi:hypothetical protein